MPGPGTLCAARGAQGSENAPSIDRGARPWTQRHVPRDVMGRQGPRAAMRGSARVRAGGRGGLAAPHADPFPEMLHDGVTAWGPPSQVAASRRIAARPFRARGRLPGYGPRPACGPLPRSEIRTCMPEDRETERDKDAERRGLQRNARSKRLPRRNDGNNAQPNASGVEPKCLIPGFRRGPDREAGMPRSRGPSSGLGPYDPRDGRDTAHPCAGRREGIAPATPPVAPDPPIR